MFDFVKKLHSINKETISDKFVDNFELDKKPLDKNITIDSQDEDTPTINETLSKNPTNAAIENEFMKSGSVKDDDIPLGIGNEIEDMPSEIIANPDVPKANLVQGNYEPTLDLNNYKYPSLDLLEMGDSKSILGMHNILASEKFQNNNFTLPIAIGKKNNNENLIVDLASMPHLLIAGATGEGKSVCINNIIISLLYKKHPSQLKFVLVDPKKVELSLYRSIEHHFLAKLPGEIEAIITDIKQVVATLNALCIEMDNRFDLLKEAGCKNIKEYNEKFVKRKLNPQKGHQFLPFIVLVIDEFADLIKEIEIPIVRLAQWGRSIGLHLILSTSRPTGRVVTNNIRMNFPAKIAFRFSSIEDGKNFIGNNYKNQIHTCGEMLLNYFDEITQLQCAFVDTLEVDKVCDFIGEQQGYSEAFLLPEYVDGKELAARDGNDLTDRDPLFEDTAKLIVQNQVGSTSLIQRRMKLGYNRAVRLMDQLEMAGIVGSNQGSKARDVLIKTDADLQYLLDNIPL